MLYDLIIDPITHAPYLKNLFSNCLYYTEEFENNKICGHYYLKDFKSKYNFDYNDDIIKLNETKEFNNLFVVMPILSLIKEHQGNKHIMWVTKFKTLIDKFSKITKNKIIIFDNHDYNYNPLPMLEKNDIKYDIIFKRVINNYIDKNIYTYPFIMCTINDPFYYLLENEFLEPVDKKNKIVWAGSLFEHREELIDSYNEYANRKGTLKKFNKKYRIIIEQKNVPYNQFLSLLNSYKYSLDLRGASRLNKRLFEIFSTNSLLIGEKIDIIWPFEEGDRFSPECFFEQGNIEDLYRIYKNFENDNVLYEKCLDNQKYIVKKYFNKEWIRNYINNIIENH